MVRHAHLPYATRLTMLEPGRLEMVERNALQRLLYREEPEYAR